MTGKAHRKFGGGLGGTTEGSVLSYQTFRSAYATDEQAIAEAVAFRKAVRAQERRDRNKAFFARQARK